MFNLNDPRWGRVVARDKTADGQLWYSVMTTGVYCRPSCPSRTANPKNVMLHDTIESARATGFRPCQRCNPEGLSLDSENAALVAKACRMIEDSEEEPSLEDLAAAVARSPSYFHRVFKASTGLTPKAYAAASRARKVRKGLETGASVTEAIYGAGFNSSGRFYEQSTGMLGMTPTQYRAGGANEEIRFAVGQSCLGAILVASSAKGVAAILLGDDPDALVRDLQDRFPRARLIGMDRDYETLDDMKDQLNGNSVEFEMKVDSYNGKTRLKVDSVWIPGQPPARSGLRKEAVAPDQKAAFVARMKAMRAQRGGADGADRLLHHGGHDAELS